VTLVVRGGRRAEAGAPADIVVDDGAIAAVVPAGSAHATTVIDATGLLVLPGMIDAHVHFDEPGREEWEGFDTGSAAAVAGGVTTVVDMPIDCDPPTTSAALVAAKADAARRHSRVDVAMWGGLVPGSAHELGAMVDAGVVGFKAFACPSGWAEFPPVDAATLSFGCRVAARAGVPVAVHCELEALGRTVESEVAAVRWAACVAAGQGARLHVVHASSAQAVGEARRWPGTTVETCPHYLLLDEDAGPRGRCSPPVRSAAEREALWARLEHGDIDWVASDHSPCPPRARATWAGIDGVGLTLPLLLSSGRLAQRQVVRLTTQAARHLRLPGKGAIAPGYDADLALVDPSATWEVGPGTTFSRHRSSPFTGMALRGRVVMTLVRGRVRFSSAEGPGDAGGAKVVRPRLT
jgi:allantoinase